MVQLRARKSKGPFPRSQGDFNSDFDSLPDPEHGTVPMTRSRPRPATTRDLADEINGLAASLEDVDDRSTERLRDLASSLSTEEGRLRWADVDLRRAFNSEYLAHFYAVRREGGYAPTSVAVVDRLRNVLVLLPIALTWFALYEATKNYRRYIDANPEEIRQPFLLLWQRGFDGEGPWFSTTFSTLAIVDAAIIFVIIVLTFYSHGRREHREESIDRTAQKFQADVDNILAEATVALAPDRAGRPAMLARSVERLAERFEHNSQELIGRLRVEHDRLEAIANRREKEFADFGVFASGMRAGAEETHRLLVELRQVSTQLQHALEDLTSEVGVTGDQNKSLLSAVTSLERLVATGIQSDHGVTRRLAEAAEVLSEAAERSLAGSEAAAQAGRVATEAVRGIAEIGAGLATGQSRVEHAIASEREANARLAEALRGGMTGVAQTAKTLAEVQAGLAGIREEFHHISQTNREFAAQMSRMLTEQTTVSTGLTRAAREMATSPSGTQSSQELSEEIAGLMKRLDTIAPVPGGNAPPAGGFESVQTSEGGVRRVLSNAPDFLSDPNEGAAPRDRGNRNRRD
ncbi:MAG: methyl-accepting chemotaxis protein [Chloroflexota bacterium]|nr:methyl-accepting chemotaxis protein [Chloroflexota bacterium]